MNNHDIQNEYIDFLNKENENKFKYLTDMTQLKILSYLLPYELHRLSKKTYTKKIKKKIFKIVKRKGRKPFYSRSNRKKLTDEEYKKYNGKKNINLFFKNMRLSYKFTYHRCINKERCRELIENDYELWDDEKAEWVEDNDNKPKNNFYYGFCSRCEFFKKSSWDNRNLKFNGKCVLLDSSDDEE